MERLTFFERYRVSVDESGQARELGRSSAAITYRAVDLQSGEPVALKLIPMRAIDPEARDKFEERVRAAQHVEHVNVVKLLAFIVDTTDYVLVSEFPQGETIASWVAAHGPLAADAALRVGLQVLSALNAAAFHGLTHSAIEPANLFIVTGQTADGGWPAIKLANIDTSGVQLLPIEGDAPVVGRPIAPQFASPQQLQNQPVDFRSEIYSLGATMCFMLTGLAPLGSAAGQPGESARMPASLRRTPRVVRDLLSDMLRLNPDERPQDPVAFAERIADCLAKVEHRHTRAAKLAIPISPVIAAPLPRRTRSFPTKPLAIAATVVVLGLIAAVLLAQPVREAWKKRHQDVTQIGVPVGVPDSSAANGRNNASAPTREVAQNSPAAPTANVAQNAPTTAESAAAPAQTQQEPPTQIVSTEEQTNPTVNGSKADQTDTKIATSQPVAAPPKPTEQTATPENEQPVQQPVTQTEERTQPAQSSQPEVAKNESESKQAEGDTSEQTAKKVATVKRQPSHSSERTAQRRTSRGEQRAQFVGTTANGEWIFEAPAGEAILDLPPDEQQTRRAPRHRQRRPTVEEDENGQEHTVLRALPVDDNDRD